VSPKPMLGESITSFSSLLLLSFITVYDWKVNASLTKVLFGLLFVGT
jgi:hypothetical protein